MIVIVEGTEGTGKTTLCERLVREQGFIRYRSFAYGERRALPTVLESLRRIGVPANDWPEDFIITDVLCALQRDMPDLNVVLDRSIISGLGYGWYNGNRTLGDTSASLARIGVWDKMMAAQPGDGVKIVYLDAPPEVAIARMAETDPRRDAGRLASLRTALGALRAEVARTPSLYIDTETHDERATYRLFMEWAMPGRRICPDCGEVERADGTLYHGPGCC